MSPPKRKKASYTTEQFEEAMLAVQQGQMSIREASKQYGVPRATLQDRIGKVHGSQKGRPTVLTEEEEEMLVVRLKIMAEWGFPLTGQGLCHFVKQYLDKRGEQTRFVDNLPTRRFVDRFLGRHKELSLRKTNPIKRARAMVSREVVEEFMGHYQAVVAGVPPENIFNFDETCMRDDPGVKKCIVKKGMKYPEKVQNTSKQTISIMFCGSAAGRGLYK